MASVVFVRWKDGSSTNGKVIKSNLDNSVYLPHGFETMFKFAQVIDPVVKCSLSEEGKPWILSPLVSSINTMTAWLPQNADLPLPPHTSRHSSDTTRSSHESGSWGLLDKLKRGHNRHGSTSSVGSRESNGSLSGSANSSTDHLDHAYGTHSRSSTPVSVAHTTGSINNGSSAGTDGDSDFPLGHWRQNLEEDTTFFIPDKHSMNTAQRCSHFQSEEARRPYMNFNTGDIRLVLSLNVRKYLNGQPVRYTCRTLDGNTIFWAVQFEFVGSSRASSPIA
ncbi:hypothetical protein BGX34_012123 [Mortierella sp. NVP85]|nr:hypothetical protein BGX34_012123 [Mortierella sp. NVP85]